MLLDSNSIADAIACVDVKLFHSYVGAALPVFTRSHACKYCHSSLFPRHGAEIRVSDLELSWVSWDYYYILFPRLSFNG